MTDVLAWLSALVLFSIVLHLIGFCIYCQLQDRKTNQKTPKI